MFAAFKKSSSMKKSLKISIPKPCHEDWSKMTPNEKGKFCNSCAKTVVDFTQKSIPEIQEFLLENRNKKVCGHFYKKQLDSIVIEIPEEVLYQNLSFSRMFLLVMLITMGTTLFSCNSANGKKQKIENIVVVDSIKKTTKQIDLKIGVNKDSTNSEIPAPINKVVEIIPPEIEEVIINGMIMGDIVESVPTKTIDFSGIEEVIEEEEDEETVFGMISEEPPQFWSTKNGSIEELKNSFSDSITKFINANFDIEKTKNLGLSIGKQKIWAQFTINEQGNIIDIKVRSPHKSLEKPTIDLLKKLPQFIPGKQRGKPVKVKYTVPIVFEVE